MALDVTVRGRIHRPRAEVAAYVCNPDHDPRWYANIREVTWHTPRPLAVGSQVARVAHFLGRRMAYTYEVVAWEPGVRFVMEAVDGPFPMHTVYTWEDAGDGDTWMTLRNHGGPTGAAALLRPLMAWAMRREMTRDLARLDAVLGTDQRPVA